jgi:hypothetical protein
MRHVSDKSCKETHGTRFMFNNFFMIIYRIWEWGKPWRLTGHMTIWRKHFPCWVTKATRAHTEYVIRNAFLRQQRLRERASMLRYTYMPVLFLIPRTETSIHRLLHSLLHLNTHTAFGWYTVTREHVVNFKRDLYNSPTLSRSLAFTTYWVSIIVKQLNGSYLCCFQQSVCRVQPVASRLTDYAIPAHHGLTVNG